MSILNVSAGGIAPLAYDSVLDSIVIPSALTISPDNSQTLTPSCFSPGGRPLSTPALVWHISNAIDFSINSSTGEITAGSNVGATASVTATYGGVTSNASTVTCLDFAGPSPDAAAVLEGIRSGLSTSLLTINYLDPSNTPIQTVEDPRVSQAVTGATFGAAGYDVKQVVDADMPKGFAWTEEIPPGINLGTDVEGLTISALNQGAITTLAIVENVHDALDTDPRWLTGYAVTSGLCIKNYNGNTLSAFAGPPVVTGPAEGPGLEFHIVDNHTLRLGSHVTNGGTTYVCIQTHSAYTHPEREPGVGGSWTSYWSVAATVDTPPAWNSAASYRAADSTNWVPLVPGSPAPVVVWYAGTGNPLIYALPRGPSQTCPTRVAYISWWVKHGTDMLTTCQGTKGLQFSPWPVNYEQFTYYTPWFDMDFTAGLNGDIRASQGLYGTTEINGTVMAYPGGGEVPHYDPTITKGLAYRMEAVFLCPGVAGDPMYVWCFQNGVQQMSSFGTPPANGATVAVKNPLGDGTTFVPYRVGDIGSNLTWGGGGYFPPRPMTRYFGELYVGGGYVNDDEAPNHFDVSIETTGPYHAGQLVTLRCCLKDGANRGIYQFPGWHDINSNGFTLSDCHFNVTDSHGATQEGLKTQDLGNLPEFTVPVRLSSFVGATTLTVKLRRFINGAFDGHETTGTVDLTVAP